MLPGMGGFSGGQPLFPEKKQPPPPPQQQQRPQVKSNNVRSGQQQQLYGSESASGGGSGGFRGGGMGCGMGGGLGGGMGGGVGGGGMGGGGMDAGMGGCSISSIATTERGFNMSAPAFTPVGVAGGGGGGVGGSGLPPLGSHYVPTQHQQFVAGAALAGLRRTGQSARHDAFFMPETLRAEIVTNREAGTYQGDPNDPRMVELQGVQIRQVRAW